MDDLELARLACAQGGVFHVSQATHLTRGEIRWRVRRGDWERLRRGVYADSRVLSAPNLDRARLELAAIRLTLRPDLVISHESAASLAGIPLLAPVPAVPRFTSARGTVERAPEWWINVAQLPEAHVVQGSCGPMTAPARTALDIARDRGFVHGVVACDGALSQRLCTPADLSAVLVDCFDWPGNRTAQEVAAFADGRAETPIESLCRIACHEHGIEPPDLQVWVEDDCGRAFARADLGWRKRRTLLEADGMVKYQGEERGPGDALEREKRRQSRLEDLGWVVVRVLWPEARFDRPRLARRILAGFAEAERRGLV
jgi:hypothetical protein